MAASMSNVRATNNFLLLKFITKQELFSKQVPKFKERRPPCVYQTLNIRTVNTQAKQKSSNKSAEETDKKLIIQDQNRLPVVTPLKRIGRNIAEHMLLAAQPTDQPTEARTLKIAVLGRPNVGKSTLVNKLLNWKICPVSEKINTSTANSSAILTKDDAQLIFIDTPGVKDVSFFRGRKKTGKKRYLSKIPTSLVCDPQSALYDADLIMVMIDASDKLYRNRLEPPILHALCLHQEKPAILVLNKVDQTRHNKFHLQLARMLTDGFVGGTRTHDKPVRDQVSKYFKNLNPDALMNEVEDYLDKREEKIEDKERDKKPDMTGFPVFSDGKVLGRKEGKKVARDEAMGMLFDKVANILRDENIIKDRVTPYSEEKDEDSIYEAQTYLNSEKETQTPAGEQPFLEEEKKIENIENVETSYEHHNQSEVTGSTTNTPNTLSKSLAPLVKDQDKSVSEIKSQAALMLSDKKWIEYFKYLRKVAGIFVKDKVGWPHFDHVFYVAAKYNQGIDALRDYLLAQAHPGDWEYHSSFVTEMEPNVLVERFIQEKCLDNLPDEVPYRLVIDVSSIDVHPTDNSMAVTAAIYCSTDSHYAIVKKRVDVIARAAKQEIMNAFRCEVTLWLTVKNLKKKKTGNVQKIQKAV
ncbi:GTPase Era, mitochondrial [Lingula anatina]|uniref:GTPase Era, mitochondrial n=1 Tax=Lingula anatina TaxID=7574 RepID=A0A1S3HDJ5_LINAN|nr:GTPase Era, mitochondrial [Lingula anatina]|eukprot:XP_013384117.1 GTPase Era, mitochondrial [Lingula anatina]